MIIMQLCGNLPAPLHCYCTPRRFANSGLGSRLSSSPTRIGATGGVWGRTAPCSRLHVAAQPSRHPPEDSLRASSVHHTRIPRREHVPAEHAPAINSLVMIPWYSCDDHVNTVYIIILTGIVFNCFVVQYHNMIVSYYSYIGSAVGAT